MPHRWYDYASDGRIARARGHGDDAAQPGGVPIGTPLVQPIHGLVTDPVTAQVNQQAYKRQRMRSLPCTVRTR